MHHRVLGRTGLAVSAVAFGAGPVPAVMIGEDTAGQRAVVARALEVGINWFDTAAGYGDGQSERHLGRVLRELGAAQRVHVATKVRLNEADLGDVEAAVRRSVEASLARLGLAQVTLLQLHNGITWQRGAIAASLTPADVLEGGVRRALARMQDSGLVRHVGLTGTGEDTALQAVLEAGDFDTIQVPHHLLAPAHPELLRTCAERGVGVFAIRVLAGGALLGQAPSAHTLRTPYFPLALYEAERRRASALESALGAAMSMKELAVRFALSAPVPHVALIGLTSPAQVDEVAALAEGGPLDAELLERVTRLRREV